MRIPASRAFGQNPLARLFLGDDLTQGCALGGGIFRMGMIVVKTRTVR